MRNKRIWVRTITRVLYAGGIVFLVSGVLLSAISIPVIASRGSAAQAPGATPTVCPCESQTPVTGVTHTPGAGGSSLIFSSGCNCSCSNAQAVVCNVGSANMQQSVNWDLYFSPDGNPVLGTKVDTGKLGPLAVGQCTTLNYTPIQPGFFAYVVKQEPTHEGPGTIWSNSCQVSGACFPTKTPGAPTLTYTAPPPTKVPTETNTVPPPPPVSTFTPPPPPPATETPTRPPMAINLSAVCGYMDESTLLWKVANHTGEAIDFTWRVSAGSSESGSGSVGGNQDTYFTTSTAAQTVQIFVNNQLADTENSVAPCKQNMVISYACTPEGILWTLRNPNDFAVDVVWSIDGQEGGRGPVGANAQVQLTVSQPGAHTVTVQWTDTRPGTHTVSLSSDVNSCVSAPPITPTIPTLTFTPTATYTQPVSTFTPTPTNTQPVITFTPTPTNTQPVITFTPTPTNTQPVITFTPTPTNTQPVITFTPTPTNTQPVITFTPTPTNTQPVITFTPTPTNTVPVSTFTFTPTNTVTPSRTPTNTNTPPAGQTSPPLNLPTFTNTPTNTNVPPTATTTPTATTVPSNTPVPTATQVNTVAPPVTVSTPIIIPVTGADMLAPARTTGLIGKLFVNIGLVMLGMALALTGLTRRS